MKTSKKSKESHEVSKGGDGKKKKKKGEKAPTKLDKAPSLNTNVSQRGNKKAEGEEDDEEEEEEERVIQLIDCRKGMHSVSPTSEMNSAASSFLLGIHFGGSTSTSPAVVAQTSLLTLALSGGSKGTSPALSLSEIDREKTPERNELAVNFLNNITFFGTVTPQAEETAHGTNAKKKSNKKDNKSNKTKGGHTKNHNSDKKKEKKKRKKKTSSSSSSSSNNGNSKHDKKGLHAMKGGIKALALKKMMEDKRGEESENMKTTRMITYRSAPVCCATYSLVVHSDHHHGLVHEKISSILGIDNKLFGGMYVINCRSSSNNNVSNNSSGSVSDNSNVKGSSNGSGGNASKSVSFWKQLREPRVKEDYYTAPITDNPGLQSLEKKVVVSYPSFVSSIRLYTKMSKKEVRSVLNKRFYMLYPKVQGTEITFSSVLRVRKKIVRFARKFLDDSTVAFGICYIESVLKGVAGDLCALNKKNFKVFSAVCLYLAVKFNQDESKTTLRTTREEIHKHMKVSHEVLLKYEFTYNTATAKYNFSWLLFIYLGCMQFYPSHCTGTKVKSSRMSFRLKNISHNALAKKSEVDEECHDLDHTHTHTHTLALNHIHFFCFVFVI